VIKQLQPFLAIALIGIATPLLAQNTSAPTPAASKSGKAQITGVVVDSLNGRGLSGADIVLEGGRASAQTDSLGKFKIDGLSPGTYQVGAFHPFLDTLGVTLLTQPFHVGPDSSSIVVLAVPSAATLVRGSCAHQPRAMGASAVIGHVNDPETLQPVANAEVSIAWADVEISKSVGVRQTPRLLRDSTDALGAFRICGLPSGLEATLQARRGSSVTAEIPISLGRRPVELLARSVLLSSADSATTSGNATLSGQVVLEGSPTNAGTRVELVGTDVVAVTNEKGEFTLRNLPSGSRMVLARHLGFAADAVPVDLSARAEKRVTIKLPKFVAVMDPVLVTARRSVALDKIGFNRRKKMGFGTYLDPDRIEQMHANSISDIMRQVPGLRVSGGPEGDVVFSSRGPGNGCVHYFLDDFPYTEMTPGDINHFVGGHEVVAVEIYQAPIIPAQYMRAGNQCTTIVLWTRFKVRG
jgi:hypothetical protein